MANEESSIAICIPNWNHRTFLHRSVGTALAAARVMAGYGVRCEVLVIDDGSRDGSQRTLFSMAMRDPDGSLDLNFAEENVGLAATRNKGLDLSATRYICFLDADNELLPENLPLFWRAIVETGAAVVYGNLIKHNGERSVGFLSNDFVHEQLYQDNYIDALALFDRNVLSSLGKYDSRMTSHEDWDMYLHLIAEGKRLVFVPACFGYYFSVENSMLQNQTFDLRGMHRIYNQRRSGFPVGYEKQLMYHPDIGWLTPQSFPRS